MYGTRPAGGSAGVCMPVGMVSGPSSGRLGRDTWGISCRTRSRGRRKGGRRLFSTRKATLPVTGRLAGLTDAEIVPLFSKKHRLTVYIQTPSDACRQADTQAARAINIITEAFVAPHPEQYVWVLKLLKTRPPGEAEPYDD